MMPAGGAAARGQPGGAAEETAGVRHRYQETAPGRPEGMTAAQIVADVRKASASRRLQNDEEGRRLQDMLDLKDTFVEKAEKTREIDSVTILGQRKRRHALAHRRHGLRHRVFSGKNKVMIGDDNSGWVACDVVEGAHRRLRRRQAHRLRH